jgi:hypothetical protein
MGAGATTTRSPAEFEATLQRYLFERSEEARAVRVGEKETSEQAAVVARYGDLFSREQLASLRACEEEADGSARERLYRLRKTCEDGIIVSGLAQRDDELENALLAARVGYRGDELPLRSAQARLAVLDDYDAREELGNLQADVSASFNSGRLELIAAGEALSAELSGIADPIVRTEEEKGIDLHALEAVLADAVAKLDGRWADLRGRWFDRLLGEGRADTPSQFHSAYLRRLSPLESTYTKERCVEVCMASLAELGFELDRIDNIHLDLDDRPQKSPRACVIASDPPKVVHLITRAMGGLHDYQAFMHEAGHALHYAGCDPSLPYTFRKLSRDHALTEIYSYICEKVTTEPAWHERYFELDEETARTNAEATVFLEALLFRRYVAKLQYELGFWGRFPSDGGTNGGYAEKLSAATGLVYRPDGYLSDMDAGFYSADYLRAWVRSAQLRTFFRGRFGEGWWRDRDAGEFLRGLFAEGTEPSSEEIAERLGYDPLDTGPLLEELGVE